MEVTGLNGCIRSTHDALAPMIRQLRIDLFEILAEAVEQASKRHGVEEAKRCPQSSAQNDLVHMSRGAQAPDVEDEPFCDNQFVSSCRPDLSRQLNSRRVSTMMTAKVMMA